MRTIHAADEIIPTLQDVEKILKAKVLYEQAQKSPNKDSWNKNKDNFPFTPWGIAYKVSVGIYKKRKTLRKEPTDTALRYFIIAVVAGWDELIEQLKRALKNWGYTKEDMQGFAAVWNEPSCATKIIKLVEEAYKSIKTTDEQYMPVQAPSLTEDIKKHSTLNPKLFNKEEVLKSRVKDKMLEIVDEFIADLKEQEIDIKIKDIILIGSNASYNYTKDSDIDLHIVADTKTSKYEPAVYKALYSAYRSLFNKQLDIKIFDIPLEIFVETEETPRASNGVYSVKKDKWVKKPIPEDIPDYDEDALNSLVDKWEVKCKEILADLDADKLKDEKKVVKLITEIYDKLRKKGVAKSEYALENLAFKELRNKGYLDKLKDSRNILVSKRLSLEERLDRQTRAEIYNQLTKAAGTQPIIQDNGMFFIYNLKEAQINTAVQALRKLPCVSEVHAYDSGKYDFSNVIQIATHKLPTKYYNIRGQLKETLV